MENKYLEKIAEKKKNQPYGYAAGGALAAYKIEPHLRGLAAQASVGPIHNRVSARHTAGEADLHTIRHYLKSTGLKKDILLDPARKASGSHLKREGSSPHYSYKNLKNVRTGELRSSVSNIKGVHPDVVMHELGHAKDYSKHITPKAILNKTYNSNHGRLGFGLAASGLLTSKKTENYAPAVAAVPALAQLRSEGAANLHAYKGVLSHKGMGAANKFLTRTALPNMMHYGAFSAMAPALTAGILMAKKKARKDGRLDE